MADDLILIRLGDSAPARVSRKAYEQIWKPKGFVLVDERGPDPEPEAIEAEEQPAEPDNEEKE